jgi:DNA primase
MNVSDEIKARIDIVDLVSETVKLRHAGKNYTGFCPFHANTRTPAFVVFPETGTWRCFGACNEGGDIFKFVMKKEGLDFSEALRLLAKKAGVKLESYTPEKQKENEKAERLKHLLEEVAIFYQSHLLNSEEGKKALQYLIEKRGINKKTIELFSLGFSPIGWEETLHHFTGKGYSTDELEQAGLIVKRDEGGFYDRFRGRIMFPVRDAGGQMTGFGARILNPEEMPKFINSPQTILFDKSRLLYGLDQARKAIRENDQAVIVEGYLDVLALHQAGFANAVSPMGTALTEMQMRLLKRYTRRIVMALDPDAAGIKATLRGLEIARDALDHSSDITFDARGLLHHESRLQADLRVSTLPQGMDPDDIVRESVDQWREIVNSAKPIITHVMNTLCEGNDLTDPKIKSRIASQVVPLIQDVSDSVERDAYLQQLARLLQVDVGAFQHLTSQSRTSYKSRKKTTLDSTKPQLAIPDTSTIKEKISTSEKYCLKLLLPRPELLYRINRLLNTAGLAEFSDNDFEDAKHQLMAKTIIQALEQEMNDPVQFIEESHLPELDELFDEINNPAEDEDMKKIMGMSEQKIVEEILRSLLLLRQERTLMELSQLQTILDEALQSQDENIAHFQQQITDHIQARGKLDRALANPLQQADSVHV